MCNEPMSEDEMCYECGCFYKKQESIVTDFYNYNARPKRSYNRLDHFIEVLGQFQGREGKDVPPEILNQISCELPVFYESKRSRRQERHEKTKDDKPHQ